MVARTVRDRKAASSNLATPTKENRVCRCGFFMALQRMLQCHKEKCVAIVMLRRGGASVGPEEVLQATKERCREQPGSPGKIFDFGWGKLNAAHRCHGNIFLYADTSAQVRRVGGAIGMLRRGRSFRWAPFWRFNAAHRCYGNIFLYADTSAQVRRVCIQKNTPAARGGALHWQEL